MSNSINLIRDRLVSRHNELKQRYTRVEKHLARDGEPLAADSSERAIQIENDESLNAISEAALEELNQLEVALQRLAAGTYGICVRCHHQIEPPRLAAVPYASTCTHCL